MKIQIDITRDYCSIEHPTLDFEPNGDLVKITVEGGDFDVSKSELIKVL